MLLGGVGKSVGMAAMKSRIGIKKDMIKDIK
jgi:hypothetical protein